MPTSKLKRPKDVRGKDPTAKLSSEENAPIVQTGPNVTATPLDQPPEPAGHPLRLHAGRVWNKVRPHKTAVSKGSTDVAAEPISQRVGRGPGYDDSKGYVNANKHPKKGYVIL